MSSSSEPLEGDKQKAKTFFQYGVEAGQKSNFDYAIQMIQEACKNDPANLKYRQTLRATERLKFKNDPAKVGRLAGARNQPIRMRARSAKGKGQYAHALEVCEEAFAHNPWDVGAAREAAEAAEQLGLKELAQWLLESVQAVCKDADFFRYMAHIHVLNSAFHKAMAAWEQVLKLNPNDTDARKEINAIAASATIYRSGLGDSLNRRAEAAAGHEASSSGGPSSSELDDMKQPSLTPEERWEKEIAENPKMIGPYLQFADHLKMRGKLDAAEKLLARGLREKPDDPSLKFAHSEVQVDRIQRAITSWEKKCRERPDDAASQAKLEELQKMLRDYEIKEFRRRIEQQPGDAHLHYELGLRLAKAKLHKEAIAAFQQARQSPALRVEALHQSGLSFEADGMLKLAERNYEDALKAADPEDVTILNALHYRLGIVHEALGNTKAAEEHYNEVAANDYGYLDVAERLRRLSS
jgi:tetratricopeptide (TPR) repeat protein